MDKEKNDGWDITMRQPIKCGLVVNFEKLKKFQFAFKKVSQMLDILLEILKQVSLRPQADLVYPAFVSLYVRVTCSACGKIFANKLEQRVFAFC